jgi:hypothetical protein
MSHKRFPTGSVPIEILQNHKMSIFFSVLK